MDSWGERIIIYGFDRARGRCDPPDIFVSRNALAIRDTRNRRRRRPDGCLFGCFFGVMPCALLKATSLLKTALLVSLGLPSRSLLSRNLVHFLRKSVPYCHFRNTSPISFTPGARACFSHSTVCIAARKAGFTCGSDNGW